MIFKLNNFDLSRSLTYFNPLIIPSFELKALDSNRKTGLVDYGPSNDKFISQLDLLLSQTEYQTLQAIITSANGSLFLQTDIDLFFPATIVSNVNVGVKSFKDTGFKNFPQTHRTISLDLIYTTGLAFNETSTSAIQTFVNRGTVFNDYGSPSYSPNLYGSGYYFQPINKSKVIEISNQTICPSVMASLLKFYLSKRTAITNLLFQPRHDNEISAPTNRDVMISDLRFDRDSSGYYSASILFTW